MITMFEYLCIYATFIYKYYYWRKRYTFRHMPNGIIVRYTFLILLQLQLTDATNLSSVL